MGAIARLGLRDYLDAAGVDVVAEEVDTTGLIARMVSALPDVVLLDLDDRQTVATARRLARQFPAVKVIACSTLEPMMRVFPPFHLGESYESPLEPAALIQAIQLKG